MKLGLGIYLGSRRASGGVPAILSDGNTVKWFDYQENVTADGSNLVSSWDNKSDITGIISGALLQADGAKQPILNDNGILFAGVDEFLKTAGFTYVKPQMIYLVIKLVSWVSNRRFMDGNAKNSGALFEAGVTPEFRAFAGASSSGVTDLIVGEYGIIRVLFNGANSSLEVNEYIPIKEDFGSADMGGLTIGANGDGALFSNIELKAIILRKIADTDSGQLSIYNFLKRKYSLVGLGGYTDKLIFYTDQSTISQNSIQIRFSSGRVKVDWGDGNSDIMIVQGTVTSNYTVPGRYKITIYCGYENITFIEAINQSNLSGDISNFKNLINITHLDVSNTNVSGDVSEWSALTNLTYLACQLTNVSGDVSEWSALTNLLELFCYNTNITGDVSEWSALSDITVLYCYNTAVNGDISSWAALTNMLRMHCHYSNVSGDISGFSAWTNAIYIYVQGTNVTGDITGWSALTNLVYLFVEESELTGDIGGFSAFTNLERFFCGLSGVYGDISALSSLTSLIQLDCSKNLNITGQVDDVSALSALTDLDLSDTSVTDYTSVALPTWNGANINLQNLSLTQAEVDYILIDLADGCGASGILDLRGNAARSSASDAAINTLTVVNSWTVNI